MTQLIEALRATAAKWRAGNQEHPGGVVLVWEGEVFCCLSCEPSTIRVIDRHKKNRRLFSKCLQDGVAEGIMEDELEWQSVVRRQWPFCS